MWRTKMLESLLKAVIDIIIETPLAVAADIVTIGDALTDKNELYTVTALKKVIDNVEDATD